MSISLLLIIVGALLIVTELILGVETGFDFLLLGLSILLGGLIGYYSTDILGVFSASLLSLSYVGLGRRYIKNKLKAFSHTSNVDTLLGRTVKVRSWDGEKNTGIVNIQGEDWRIITTGEKDIEEGKLVKILDIDGVSLIVEPVGNKEE